MGLSSAEYTALFENVGALYKSIKHIRNMVLGTPNPLYGDITGITEADPAVVTSANHGLSHGDRITIQGVGGMVEVNEREFVVLNPDTNTFELGGEDSQGHTTYTSGGTWSRVVPQPDLPALLDTIETTFNANGRNDVLSGLPQAFDSFKDAGIGWVQVLLGKIGELLQHRTTILEKLPGLETGASLPTILYELHRDMVDSNETVQRSTVSIGAISADAGNTGTGTVLTTKVLDGVTEPHPGWPANPLYGGVDSELSISEEMTLTCVRDEDMDGENEGEETFRWTGKPQPSSPLSWENEGSGTNVEFRTMNANSLIVANKNFEQWSSQLPVSWDADSGTGGTHIVQETTAADVYRGENALRLDGDGTLASIQLSQTLPLRGLVPGKRYCLSFRVKASATISNGTLTVQFEDGSGNGIGTDGETSDGTGAQVQIDPGDLPTTWTLHHFFFNAPATIGEEDELVIKWTGTPDNGKSVWIDSLAVDEVRYANGIGMVVVAGDTQFVRGDRFNTTITNDNKGLFQTLFRRQYRVQLPSSDTPSIEDLLAA